ncbi:hypothetical protein BDN70DRAFT_807554 [Pholiota conissans]|uniref:BTB domain-containing protein n=1 Tax=Pholiota conissans TaxID=109636 RepID=A0A9P5Z0C3_9AGAR|nr:hypothetical protein BDN70DRAFT_807554 [Pholiota conissans]
MASLADVDHKNLQTLVRHPVYYISTGDLSFLVEHVQFRVHKYFFDRESTYFGSKLSVPQTPGTPLRGSSDANAILLDAVTAEEFAKFLWVFYNPKYSIYDAPTEDWEIILILAHRWGFPEVKNLAVRELEKKTMLDVKRIKLYHDTHVARHFLIPRYAALCEREEPLSLAEGMDLGMETTLMIARGREEARASRSTSGVRSPLTPTIHGADLHEFIRELFQIGADADTTTTTTAGGEGSYTTGALVAHSSSSSSGHASLTPSVIITAGPETANGTTTNGGGAGHTADADADDSGSSTPHTEGDHPAPTSQGGAGNTGKGDHKKGGKNGATTDKGDHQAGDGDDNVPGTPGDNKQGQGQGQQNKNKGSRRRQG